MTPPFLINHLWQSSGFAVLAGLMAFLLRRNSAKVRYWVWLCASLKFLLPFALLVNLGSFVPRPDSRAASVDGPVFSNAVVQIAAPFSPVGTAAVPPTDSPDWVPIALGLVWALGFLAIIFSRWRSWLRVRATLRTGTPVELPIPVRTLVTDGMDEPGVVGFLRPVLVLPRGLMENLDQQQLHAVLSHELCHVRRRDNFFAAAHMVVEAIFWFHPLVWWIGSRMVEERELACDEEVLRLGFAAADYVEGILRVCRFYTESPLPCISGVTGADVKKRLRAILGGCIARELTAGKKAILVAVGVVIISAPVVIGVLTAPSVRAQNRFADAPKFEVASIRVFRDDGGPRNSAVYGPQGVNFGGLTLAFIIGEAYQFPVGRIQGTGSLTKAEFWQPLRQGYDIVAKGDHPVPKDQLRLMLQSLLAERFKLAVHREAKTGPIYNLMSARNGPKLDSAQTAESFSFSNGPDGYSFRNADMVRLSAFLSGVVDRPVVDHTGLKGLYNFTLKHPDEVPQDKSRQKTDDGVSPDSPSGATFGEALKQLGLQLTAATGPVDYLVIDSVEKPSEN